MIHSHTILNKKKNYSKQKNKAQNTKEQRDMVM